MGICAWCAIASKALALLALSAASVMDYKYREVEPAYWYAVLRIAIPLGALYMIACKPPLPLRIYLGMDAAALGIAAAAYLAGLLGGGDVLAIAVIAAATPAGLRELIVPSMLALLYGGLAAALIPVAYCVLNISRHSSLLASLAREGGASRAMQACFSAVPVRVSEALRRPWLYPTAWEVGERYNIVESNPPDMLAEIAAERGLDAIIWVTPGLPLVLFITIGYAAALALGDKPLILLIQAIKPGP
ncbi:MAG: hypothetical protein GSR80_000522 [Desulfurococcales archaeon]|nr:hypothetical protein [Desulfurococcales archaeon]